MSAADPMRGYWVVLNGKDAATISAGPFADYVVAAHEAERIGSHYRYVVFNVRYGTEQEVKRI